MDPERVYSIIAIAATVLVVFGLIWLIKRLGQDR